MESQEESIRPTLTTYDVIRSTWLSRPLETWAAAASAVMTLIVVISSLIYARDIGGLKTFMSASPELIFEKKEYWRLWTTLLVHGDEKHLLSNSFFLFVLGTFLIGYFGFLLFPVAAFVFGGITNYLVLAQMPEGTGLVGVSGVVFWMGGAWLVLYFLLDRARTVSQRALRSIGVGLVLFVPADAFDPQISYKSHLIGFLLGCLWGFIHYTLRKNQFRAAEIHETVIDEG